MRSRAIPAWRHARLAGIRIRRPPLVVTLAALAVAAAWALAAIAGDELARPALAAARAQPAHMHDGTHGHPGGHEGGEGLALAAGRDAAPRGAFARCVAGVQVREYDVVAVDVDITIDRYLDHDPKGRMYV